MSSPLGEGRALEQVLHVLRPLVRLLIQRGVGYGALTATHNFPASSLRGLVAHDDGKYAVLLWDANAKIMYITRRNADGTWHGLGIGALATLAIN